MNKKKWIIVLDVVLAIIFCVLLGSSLYHGVNYAKYYDKEVLTATEMEQSRAFFESKESNLGMSEDQVESFTYKVKKLAGSVYVETITCKEGKLTVDAEIKSGKAKILITAEKNERILSKPLEEQMEISVKPGEYKVYMVGDWFSGKVNVGNKQTSNFTKQDKSWENDFIATLDTENYLGNDIVADLKDVKVKTVEDSDDNTTFVISKVNKEGVDIHNVQYIVKDDLLESYRYKNYTFKSNDGKKIDKSEAEKIVKSFAKEFISDGNKLKFENNEEQQVQSLYDSGKVETWYAKDGNNEYHIVIDLGKGYVVYYQMDSED